MEYQVSGTLSEAEYEDQTVEISAEGFVSHELKADGTVSYSEFRIVTVLGTELSFSTYSGVGYQDSS